MPGRRLSFGPFQVDRDAAVVLRDGEPLAVGHRGVQLLEALLSRPGDVITKSELMDAAWGGAAVEESNLSVQVAALRKALGRSPSGGEWVVTVPRVGYRFVRVADPAAPGIEIVSERRSIAILPFENLSADPEQAFFADGLAEEIITMLSKLPGLLVIARNSSFAYRERSVDIRQVAEELDVRFVLAGSVRRGGDRIRVSVQLADAETGGHLWAERYDRELGDVFAIQDEVTRRIVEALQLTLGPAEATRLSEGGTRDLEAQDLVQRARAVMWGPTKNRAVFERVSDLLRRAIAKDPDYTEAYITLSNALIHDYLNRWTADPEGSLAEARQMAERAVQLAPQTAGAHVAATVASMIAKDFVYADRELDIAASLSPNNPGVFDQRGGQLMRRGDPLGAIPYFEQAMRLNPAATIHYLHMLGHAYFQLDRFETAAALSRERILLVPDSDMSRSLLVSALGHLGRSDEAREVHSELMKINPKYDLAAYLARSPLMAGDGYRERTLEGWRMAGLPVA
jgi:TolB-like protein/Flp pilus assembly protein TadD